VKGSEIMILVFDGNMEIFYYVIALGFTAFFALQSILAIIGNVINNGSDFEEDFDVDEDFDIDIDEDIDIDVDEDMDIDIDEDIDVDEDMNVDLYNVRGSFHLVTFRTIIGFFMLFGWTGFLYTRTGVAPVLVFIYAVIAGLAMMFLIALSIFLLMRLESDGTMRFADSIGKTGTVYLKIPMAGQGTGKVQIIVGGSLRTLDAVAYDTEIETDKKVKVIEVKNNLLVVEEIKEESKEI